LICMIDLCLKSRHPPLSSLSSRTGNHVSKPPLKILASSCPLFVNNKFRGELLESAEFCFLGVTRRAFIRSLSFQRITIPRIPGWGPNLYPLVKRQQTLLGKTSFSSISGQLLQGDTNSNGYRIPYRGIGRHMAQIEVRYFLHG